jgi:hypothetical protein
MLDHEHVDRPRVIAIHSITRASSRVWRKAAARPSRAGPGAPHRWPAAAAAASSARAALRMVRIA